MIFSIPTFIGPTLALLPGIFMLFLILTLWFQSYSDGVNERDAQQAGMSYSNTTRTTTNSDYNSADGFGTF